MEKIKCPRCNNPIWDIARGHKLNKCHKCNLAFDGPFNDDEPKSNTSLTLAELLDHKNEAIKRNAIGILKQLNKNAA